MTRWWPLLLVLACAGCELADADELLFGPPVGSGVVSLPFDATQSPGCMSWDGTNIDTNPSNPACAGGGGSPAPTVTPFACGTGYAVQVVGATPGCVLLPTPDGAGAGAAATQTPWSCGAGNGARGMGGTPECFVVPTPDGSVATVTPGGGTPQPIATSTSAPGTADGFARADHVHHIADGAIGPAKLSAAVPTPQPVPTAVAFVNQANSFTGTNEFLNNVDLNSPARLALDPTGCVGAACSKVILRDNEGSAAIIYTASTPGLWSATGTGINRANDLACTGCVDVSDLGFATPTPVPTTHNDLSGLQGGAAGEYYHLSSAQYSAKILATPTATVTATPVACGANSYDAVIGPDVGTTCVAAVTPVSYVTPTPVPTPGSDPALAAGQCAWANGYDGLVCEGSTANTIETHLVAANPTTSDKTITLPDATGTVALLERSQTFTGVNTFTNDVVIGGGTQTTLQQVTVQSGYDFYFTDGSGNGAQFTAASDLFAPYGTGTVRANDVSCASAPCVTLSSEVAGTLPVSNGGTGATALTDLIALGTHTTGNYAAGDAEGGAATSGDSATAFFSSGTIEAARLPNADDDGTTKGIAAFADVEFDCTNGVCSLSSAVSKLGQTIEGSELSTSFTLDATHGIDGNSGVNKAPVDLPRDTAANLESVTSEGRVSWSTDDDLLGVGTGTTRRKLFPIGNYGASPTPVATVTVGGPTGTPAPTSTNLPTPLASPTGATATPTPYPTVTPKAGVDGRPVFGMCWAEGSLSSAAATYLINGAASGGTQAAWTPARPFDVWVGLLCVKPQFDALQGEIRVTLFTNDRAGCRPTAEAGNANCGTAPARHDAVSVSFVGTSSWYDSDSQCSTGWVRVPANVLYRFQETVHGWHSPPGANSPVLSATWMVCAAAPF